MSRVYFHSQERDAEITGSERAYAASITRDCLMVSLNLAGDNFYPRGEHPIYRCIPSSSYVHKDRSSLFSLRTWISCGLMSDEHYFQMGEEKYDICQTELNTALVMGGDCVKLLARIHGQCEIHCWVDGRNREWLAGIIERGRASGLYRPDSGWEDAAKLLRETSNGEVVMSYSVCEQFPSPFIADQMIADEDHWEEMSEGKRWQLAIKALRRQDSGLELTPNGWNDYYFGHGMNGYKVMEYAARKAELVEV